VGSFRFFLALCVVAGHARVNVLGFAPGVVAVISFFLLSGYVMTMLIGRYYASPDRISDFYLDRCARLFPQFLFYCALTIIAFVAVPLSSKYLSQCTAQGLILNLPILPLAVHSLYAPLHHCILIPQAWSLGLEACFYLLIPFLVLFLRRPALIAVSIASAMIFLAAHTGIINSDLFGYRLLPGVLFIFLMGSGLLGPTCSWALWLFTAILLGFSLTNPTLWELHHSKEVLLGVVVGYPVLLLLSDRRFSSFDEFAGNLSYGVFLNHFLVIWLFKSGGIPSSGVRGAILVVLVSIAMALITYYIVERPALRWRRSLRKPQQSSSDAADRLVPELSPNDAGRASA
jgi:peptidoglycan/LPS O-acetylase OafA/YrhL